MKTNKLFLNKETLRLLNDSEQPAVVAGAKPIPTRYVNDPECEAIYTKVILTCRIPN